ncbi:MAG: SGNH hydrolase-type esterase domain-containing protein [Monoraphidium minutum]|nr:MAG: SGNH hydrolase-type esterase domain-containing protein [Monoraphidium minutum]
MATYGRVEEDCKEPRPSQAYVDPHRRIFTPAHALLLSIAAAALALAFRCGASSGAARSSDCSWAARASPYGAASPAPAMANEQPPILRRPAILLFGDSLTERSLDPQGGWGAALAHHYARKADVINRGFGGYNSRWALPVLEQVLSQVKGSGQEVLLATLWLGANDAAMPDRGAARQHVPVAEFTSNLEAMVAAMRAAGIPRVVLITPPPVDDAGRAAYQQQRNGSASLPPPDRTDGFTSQYAKAVRGLGARLAAPVLDLDGALRREEAWASELLTDGLHFSPAGQALVGRLMIELLADKYPDLGLTELSNHFPWWDKYADAGPAQEAALWRDFMAGQGQQAQQARVNGSKGL